MTDQPSGDDTHAHKHRIHFSSGRQDWATPGPVFGFLTRRYGPYDLDVAASAANTRSARYFTKHQNALDQRWNARAAWCNPPHDLVAEFVEKAIQETQAGCLDLVTLFVSARPDTVWFREAWEHSSEVLFLSGRVTFVGGRAPAPFPSAAITLTKSAKWSASSEAVYSMPKRHGGRKQWYIARQVKR